MTIPRLAAVIVIFLATAAGWFVLGTSIVVRTGEHDARLQKQVAQLSGGAHTQVAPDAWIERRRETTDTVEDRDAASGEVRTRREPRTVVDHVAAPLMSTRADVVLDLDYRQKGLLWYDTYSVRFSGEYRFRNPHDERTTVKRLSVSHTRIKLEVACSGEIPARSEER